jgi:hypothetical protein
MPPDTAGGCLSPQIGGSARMRHFIARIFFIGFNGADLDKILLY